MEKFEEYFKVTGKSSNFLLPDQTQFQAWVKLHCIDEF